MNRTARSWQWLAGLAVMGAVLGCSGGGERGLRPIGDRDAGTEEDAGPKDAGARDVHVDPCRSPSDGCPCESPGETLECGRVERISGDYVSCSVGIRTCGEDQTWGDCIGDRIVEIPVGESKPQALGTSTHCVDNPCDPYCEWFVDNPVGVPLGDAGLGLDDGGIHLIKGPPKSSSGIPCTGIAVSPASQTLTVTTLNTAKDLKGEYFNQRSSSGISSSWSPTAVRRDATVDFDWGSGSTGLPGMLADDFSVRWTGYVIPSADGNYRFYTRSDDGVRLWIDDDLVIDQWRDQGTTEHSSSNIALSKNVAVSLKLEYYERGGGANVQLLWSGPGISKQIIPAASLSGSSMADPFTVNPEIADFSVTTVPSNCYTGKINAAWSLDRLDLATIDGAGDVTLFSPVAGSIGVRAYAGQFDASGSVNVVVNVRDTSDAPAGKANVFNGAGSGSDPMQVLYPYADTVFPLGLKAPVIQWSTGGSAAGAVKVGLRYPATGTAKFSWEKVIAETSPPRAIIPPDVWDYFEQTAKGQEAAYTIQRYIGTSLRPTVTRKIRFANAPLRGKIYYTEYARADWHAYIMGVDPGSQQPAASVFSESSETSGNKCPVCHSVSANGQTFVTSNRGWSSNGGVSRIESDGSFTRLTDFPYSSSYATNSDDWRGFAWAPLTPDGTLALAANNIWGNTDQDNVAGINTSNRTINAPSKFLSGGRGLGLTARYYDSNNLSGAAYQRTDARVAFSWSSSAPHDFVGSNNFSVRWTGFVEPLTSETYTFQVVADDGVRLVVDNQTLIDAWSNSSGSSTSTRSGSIALEAGTRYPIRLDYVDKSGNASVTLRWSSANVPQQVIPQAQLHPEAPGSGVEVSYYDTSNFSGASLTRVEPDVAANWGNDAPAPGFGSNSWSARWQGQLRIPVAGNNWRLCLDTGSGSGDSVKLFLNGSGSATISQNSGGSYCTGNLSFSAGQLVPFRIDYDDNSGSAELLFEWIGPSIPRERIPSDAFFLPASYVTPTNGITATYYDTDDFNAGASGSSVDAFSRIESTINEDWGSARPNYSMLTSSNTWSVRYTGLIQPSCTGLHEFQVQSDDGATLWIDTIRVTTRSSAGSASGPIHLSAGQFYELKLDLVEDGGDASVSLRWRTPCGGSSFSVVPNANLFPSGDVGWSGYVRGGGDNGSDFSYKVWQMPQATGVNPVDVTSQSAHNWGLGDSVMMVPSFAPDGTKLVFIDGDQAGGAGWRKGLSTFDFDQSAKLFKERRLIVNNWPLGDVLKWPTFESDSRSVIFQTSTPTEFCCRNSWTRYGHMAPTNYYEEPGRLWSVDTSADAPQPIELVRLNQGERDIDRNKAYQPTMLPKAAAGYRWAVFTSTRPYGNVLNTTNQQVYSNIDDFTPMLNYNEIQSQLWVAAIDDTTSGSTDRSHPAFWLPNQNYSESASSGFINERAFWVLDECRPVGSTSASTCEVDEDCCGGDTNPKTAVCRIDTPVTTFPPTRHCATVSTSTTCHLPGDGCTADAECCEGGVCINGTCAEPPSLGAFYPANFERTYVSECPAGTQAIWRFFDVRAETPPVNSKIEVFAESAGTPGELHTIDIAPSPVTESGVVYLGAISGATFPGWQGFDVGRALRDAGEFSWQNLKITLRLIANEDLSASPVVYEWRQSYSCPPSE